MIQNGEVNFDNLNKNELFVYQALSTNPAVTRTELIETLNISTRTIERAICSTIALLSHFLFINTFLSVLSGKCF